MNVLLLGSGGREHAIAWKISQSANLTKLYIAPGNPGMASYGINVPIGVSDFQKLKQFVLEKNIDMLVVGPEIPLVEGIVDFFTGDEALKNISVIGPSKDGALLEGSKDFAKTFMQKYHIPTARYKTFTQASLKQGIEYLKQLTSPYVLKADGLAAGKGVVICPNLANAKNELTDILKTRKFGKASDKVIIEEYLQGIELSVFVLTDGENYKVLPAAKDYKRIGNADTGLNTGGMGSVSPVPFAGEAFMEKVEEQIIIPTINGLKAENILYKGFLFIGLMNVEGNPFVIEYNVRMGDPETESVFPRIESDILDLFEGVAKGTLSEKELKISPKYAACIMAVSKGYPESYPTGKQITGLEEIKDSLVFHAGTRVDEKDHLLTNGGRVLAITSLADTLQDALQKSYENMERIRFEGKYYRLDIGKDLLY